MFFKKKKNYLLRSAFADPSFISKNFRTIIDKYLEIDNSIRKLHDDFVASFGVLQYLKEFRTVSFDSPRQTGKTTAIIDTATKNDIVVVNNRHSASFFKERGLRAISSTDKDYIQSVIDQTTLFTKSTARVLWIDNAKYVHINDLLDILLENRIIDKNTLIFKVG